MGWNPGYRKAYIRMELEDKKAQKEMGQCKGACPQKGKSRKTGPSPEARPHRGKPENSGRKKAKQVGQSKALQGGGDRP